MISVLLATTGRPDMVEEFVASLVQTTGGYHLELVVTVDQDPETVRGLQALALPARVHLLIDHKPELRGSSKAWNDALALSTGDPVILAGDDLEFQPGWLDAAKRAMRSLPQGWGVVGFNDGHWSGGDGDFATHYMVSRRFILDYLGGVIAWECYTHSFNDVEMTQRARNARRYVWAEDARVYHSHWLFGDREQDDTDRRNLARHGESQRVYLERQRAGFPIDHAPAIRS